MDSILPDRLLALVRPGNDLVLRRIRNLKRCVEACGCKIMTPRYACNLAPGCISSDVKLCQRKSLFPFFFGTPFFGTLFFLLFCFFLALQSLARLKCNLEPNCKHISGTSFCSHTAPRTQRFRFRILRRTRSFPGRTSARSLSGRIESIWETPSKERARRTL